MVIFNSYVKLPEGNQLIWDEINQLIWDKNNQLVWKKQVTILLI